ncbi:YqaJ viral recombinase family protein [bacterium]|nr:YqaJ viral recombinase family protein [bacterium]
MTKRFDKKAWLEERRKGIGSSDAAAIMGISPFKTAAHVQIEKLQGVETQEETDLMHLGTLLEDDILQLYAEREGKKPRRVNRILYHKEFPFIAASLDAMVPVMTPLEVKMIVMASSGKDFGKELTDEIPDHYIIQTQHQMFVTAAEVCEVPVLLYGKLRLYQVKRNQGLINHIVDRECAFWQDHIVDQKPVDLDFNHPRTLDLVQNMFGLDPGKCIELKDPYAGNLASQYLSYTKAKSEVEKSRNAIKAELLSLMGDAELARLDDGLYITRKEVERNGYEVKPCTYIDFRIKEFKSKVKE